MTHTTFYNLYINLNQELVFVAHNICSQKDPGVDEGNRKQQPVDCSKPIGWDSSFVGIKEAYLEEIGLEFGYWLGTDYQLLINFVEISILIDAMGLLFAWFATRKKVLGTYHLDLASSYHFVS